MEQRQPDESQPGCSYEICKLCGERITGSEEMLVHTEHHYNYAKYHDKNGYDKYHCEYCHAVFITKELYRDHIIEHHYNTKNYVCTVCDAIFQSGGNLLDHMKSSHSDYECPLDSALKCFHCSTVFKSKITYATHRGRRLPRREGTCQVCKKYFCTRPLLRNHQDQVHNMQGQTYGKFFCEPCNKYFRNRKTFRVHNYSHEAGKFHCNICKKVFGDPDERNRHKETHEQPIKCKHCPAIFRTRGNLMKHSPLHTPRAEWKYSCDVCEDEKFPTRRGLMRHMKRDENKHMFKCPICQFSCLGLDSIKRHCNQQHGVNFYTP